MERSIPVIVHCPQCPNELQGSTIRLADLQQSIVTGEPFIMFGTKCGHTWPLPEQELEAFKKKYLLFEPGEQRIDD